MSGRLLSTGAGWARPPAPRAAVTPLQVHSVYRPEGAIAGPAGVQCLAMASVGPRGPQAKGDGGQQGGSGGLWPGQEKGWPLVQAWHPPLWSAAVLPCTGAAESVDGPAMSEPEPRGRRRGCGFPTAGSPSPSVAALRGERVQPREHQQCGAGRGTGALERAGRAPGARQRVQLLPSSWAGPEVRVCTRVHAYTCARVVCVHDCARMYAAEARWAHPPCSPQRRGGFSKWVLCPLRRPWARSCPRSSRTELPEGLADRPAWEGRPGGVTRGLGEPTPHTLLPAGGRAA